MEKNVYTWIEFIIFIIFLIPIIITDIRTKRIPDICIFTCLTIILILKILFNCNLSPWQIVVNIIVGFMFFWVIWFVSKGKVGLGDAKLSALMALVLGLPGWLLSIFFAAISGLIIIIIRVVKAKMKKDDAIPFAPFLAVGSIIAFLVGDLIFKENIWMY